MVACETNSPSSGTSPTCVGWTTSSRRHDDNGLPAPFRVNPGSGYRSCTPQQARDAPTVARSTRWTSPGRHGADRGRRAGGQGADHGHRADSDRGARREVYGRLLPLFTRSAAGWL